jgi:cytochrome c biogenesis protein CcmG/thiol:disulfide interchange protein DsbE
MTRRLRLLGLTLFGVAVLAVVLTVGLASEKSAKGRPAPALPREHLAGAPVSLSSLLAGAGGHPALVVFWASWCGPCEQEAAAVEGFSRSPLGRGRIVGVDWSDALSGARAFIARYRWSFPNLRDSEGTVGTAYRLTGLPTTFVLDSQGRIRAVLRGPQDQGSLGRALAVAEHA